LALVIVKLLLLINAFVLVYISCPIEMEVNSSFTHWFLEIKERNKRKKRMHEFK